MKPLTVLATLLGFAAATAGVRAETPAMAPKTIKSGEHVMATAAEGGSALAGPFYIAGAEPGDLIVVSIDKLEPKGTTGMAPAFMAPVSFDPGALSNKPVPAVPWTIDKAKGVVRLDLQAVIPNVKWLERYTSTMYELPLKPMLSALGVAPTDGAMAPAAGPFGGMLDYAGITSGVKVLLPVYQAGALLSLGHGYARQGDGAAAGSGIETAMDVEFSVELVKKKEWPHSSVMRAFTVAGEFPIEWPRIVAPDYIAAVGSAPTLLGALQHATSELHHWMDDDYGFSEKSLSIFLGQAMEYDIAHIGDQSFTVIAKVKTAYLPKEAK